MKVITFMLASKLVEKKEKYKYEKSVIHGKTNSTDTLFLNLRIRIKKKYFTKQLYFRIIIYI